jgi:hypothetical protein
MECKCPKWKGAAINIYAISSKIILAEMSKINSIIDFYHQLGLLSVSRFGALVAKCVYPSRSVKFCTCEGWNKFTRSRSRKRVFVGRSRSPGGVPTFSRRFEEVLVGYAPLRTRSPRKRVYVNAISLNLFRPILFLRWIPQYIIVSTLDNTYSALLLSLQPNLREQEPLDQLKVYLFAFLSSIFFLIVFFVLEISTT